MLSDGKLVQAINGRAELILGDIRDTVHPFLASLDPSVPLGFISVDVDIYTSAKHSLMCLLGAPELYNPGVSIYFDDVGHFFANRWCGELAAIEEFNAKNKMRKIDRDRSQRHPAARWFQGMYVCHILDHPFRNNPDPNRRRKTLAGGNVPLGVLD
jgi:hypothetical protein